MRKRYGCLALAVLLLAGSGITAQAEEQKGKDGWKAVFTGKAIESNFSSQSFADEVSGLQPGDSIEIKVAVENESGGGTDWYMSNEVVQSLEDSSSAKGGAYRYVLTYQGKDGETVLYSSDSVGGETVTSAGEGLHEATDNLEQFFYLDHLEKNEKGSITLLVSLNGETQGNAYQNTLARLQLNFAVEKTAGGGNGGGGGGGGSTPDTPGTPGSPDGPGTVFSPGVVRTGDPGGMVFWSMVALICGLGLLVCGVLFQRRSEGGYEDE